MNTYQYYLSHRYNARPNCDIEQSQLRNLADALELAAHEGMQTTANALVITIEKDQIEHPASDGPDIEAAQLTKLAEVHQLSLNWTLARNGNPIVRGNHQSPEMENDDWYDNHLAPKR